MSDQRHENDGTKSVKPVVREPWEEPKLEFVEPKLVKQGEMKQITAGFIGTFVPQD